MRQSTYIIGSPDLPGVVKIGRASHPELRLRDLQCGSPLRLKLVHVWPHNIERHLHQRFAAKRRHGEWFEVPAGDVIAAGGRVVVARVNGAVLFPPKVTGLYLAQDIVDARESHALFLLMLDFLRAHTGANVLSKHHEFRSHRWSMSTRWSAAPWWLADDIPFSLFERAARRTESVRESVRLVADFACVALGGVEWCEADLDCEFYQARMGRLRTAADRVRLTLGAA